MNQETFKSEYRIAAVILNHGDNGDTLVLARSYLSMKGIDRVAVVDNSPEDRALTGRETELQDSRLLFLRTVNRGYAAGNNEAVRALTGRFGFPRYILISNPDVEVEESSILACMDFLEVHADYAAAAPRTLRPDGSPHERTAWRERTLLCDVAYSSGILSRCIGMYRELYPLSHWDTPYSTVDCVAGSFFLIRYDAFEKAGGFDEHTFLFYEEDILGIKFKRLGYKEAVLNGCSFVHREGISAGRKIRYLHKYLTMQKSRLYFHRQYKRQPFYRMAVLYAATGLGIMENLLKTLLQALLRNHSEQEDART